MSNKKDNHVSVEQPPDQNAVLYRVRNSQVPNALALPLVLSLIVLVGSVLVTFYSSRDSLSNSLRAEIDKCEQTCIHNIERTEDHLGKEIVDLKVSTKENRNQIVILWQRIGGGGH